MPPIMVAMTWKASVRPVALDVDSWDKTSQRGKNETYVMETTEEGSVIDHN